MSVRPAVFCWQNTGGNSRTADIAGFPYTLNPDYLTLISAGMAVASSCYLAECQYGLREQASKDSGMSGGSRKGFTGTGNRMADTGQEDQVGILELLQA